MRRTARRDGAPGSGALEFGVVAQLTGMRHLHMRETLELRVNESHAPRVFGAQEGVALSDRIRRVILATNDDRLPLVRDLHAELRESGSPLFFGWTYHRHYTRAELGDAPFLTVTSIGSINLSGELAGTVYDTVSACPVCKAGRRRLSPLRLQLSKLPRLRDITRSPSDEWIVSERFVEACSAAGARGVSFSPVEFRRAPAARTPPWFEMSATSPPVCMHPGTQVATGPFPDSERDVEAACPLGDTIGHARISEVHLDGVPAADVSSTREYLGSEGGLFTPSRELVISGRLYNALLAAGIRGLAVEIARIDSTIAAHAP